VIEWRPVVGSSVIRAEAYDAERERIYVRYHGGDEWWYGDCPGQVWQEFTAPGQSRGTYINTVLKDKPSGLASD
jgi:KTSC domain